MERLFTIILEYKGGTYISQMRGTQLDKVYSNWLEHIEIPGIELGKKNFIEADIDTNFTPLEGLTNVWCITFLLDDELGLVNIVETVG